MKKTYLVIEAEIQGGKVRKRTGKTCKTSSSSSQTQSQYKNKQKKNPFGKTGPTGKYPSGRRLITLPDKGTGFS